MSVWSAARSASTSAAERDTKRTNELGASPKIVQELVIFQSPHSLATCRLEPVDLLQLSAYIEISFKEAKDHCLFVLFGQEASVSQHGEVAEKRQLMSRAIVDARPVTESVVEVVDELWSYSCMRLGQPCFV